VVNPVSPSPLKTAAGAKAAAPALDRPGSSITAAARSELPRDRFTASILSFARFFSLSLDHDLVAKIRRLVLRAEKSKETGPEQFDSRLINPQSGAEKRASGKAAPANMSPAPGFQSFREALSLAALAAEHKGVELSPQALAEYAAALDPAENADPGEKGQGSRGGGRNGQQSGDEQNDDNDSWGSPAGLKLKISEEVKKSPLLELLNSIPGKDGRRWIALPFSFSSKGILYRVSMRILLRPRGSKITAEHLALDIVRFDRAENSAEASPVPQDSAGDKIKNRRLFIVSGENPARLDLRLKPFPEKKMLHFFSRELSELLKIPREQIFIKKFEDSFDFMADNRINILPSVNKEV
jgi:hypothetical protein